MSKGVEVVTFSKLRYRELLQKEKDLKGFVNDGNKFHPLKENGFYQWATTVEYYWYRSENEKEDYEVSILYMDKIHYGYCIPLCKETVTENRFDYVGKCPYRVLMGY